MATTKKPMVKGTHVDVDDGVIFETAFIHVDALEAPDFNPPTRTTEKNIKKLRESIDKHGQLNPCLVVPIKGEKDRFIVAEGNRRTMSLKLIGKEYVFCRIIRNKEVWEVYVEANSNVKSHNGNQSAIAYHVNPMSVTKPTRDKLDVMKAYLGESNFEYVVYGGGSYRTFQTIKKVCDFIGKTNDNRSIRRVIEWLGQGNIIEAREKDLTVLTPDELLRIIHSGINLKQYLTCLNINNQFKKAS